MPSSDFGLGGILEVEQCLILDQVMQTYALHPEVFVFFNGH